MRKSKPTQCGKCGGNTPPFTLFANATTAESYALCINCMGNQSTNHIDDLAEIDALIEEQEELLAKMEPIIQEAGDMEVPPELEAFAFTPLKTYKMIQMTLASLKTKRVELLSTGENEYRLKYELDKKIAAEEYEAAKEIQERLDKLKKQPAKKQKQQGAIKTKKPANLFVSEEAAAGRCIRCNTRFPKPAGLFKDFDIGNCHDMCLPCCAYEVPKYIHSVEIIDQMIVEMEKFAKMMGGMSLLSRLMTEGDSNLDFEKEKAALNSNSHPESKLVIDHLRARKDFLLDSNKKEAISGEINGLVEMLDELVGDDKELAASLLAAFNQSPSAKSATKPTTKSKKSKKKTKVKKKKQLSAKEIMDKGNAWIKAQHDEASEKCPACKQHPVKPSIIFKEYDLGDSQELCFICSMIKLPLQIATVAVADDMIAEMQAISDYFDEMMVISELYRKGEKDKIKALNVKEMEVKVQSPEQFIARQVVEALQHRRKFLMDIGENNEMKDLADTLIRILKSGKSKTDK